MYPAQYGLIDVQDGLNGIFRPAVGQIALSLHNAEGVQTISMTQSVMVGCLQGPASLDSAGTAAPDILERGGTRSVILVSLIHPTPTSSLTCRAIYPVVDLLVDDQSCIPSLQGLDASPHLPLISPPDTIRGLRAHTII